MIIVKTSKEEELKGLASRLLSAFPYHRIFAVEGEMGAGKTTLIKALCSSLRVSDEVDSPTFSIINVYTSPQGFVYHFDLYRLKNIEEFVATGAIEYLESGDYCFIEWPEKALSMLPPETISIKIEVEEDGSRIYKIEELKQITEYF